MECSQFERATLPIAFFSYIACIFEKKEISIEIAPFFSKKTKKIM